MTIPHPDIHDAGVNCAVVTVSDTRTSESDRSGQLLQEYLTREGHIIVDYHIFKDEPHQIRDHVEYLCQRKDVDAVVLNGGTGIAPRDTTYDAIASLLTKELPGFGELFRWLSYQEIGSRAIASRSIAGVRNSTLIFSVPGSSNAVALATEKLIIPELRHLVSQLHGQVNPGANPVP